MSNEEIPDIVPAVPVPPGMTKVELPADKPFRVSASANVNDLAWSAVKAMDEGCRPILIGIGVQAVSQAVKAVAVANSRVASQGKMFTILPAFENTMIPDPNTGVPAERTLIKLILVSYRF